METTEMMKLIENGNNEILKSETQLTQGDTDEKPQLEHVTDHDDHNNQHHHYHHSNEIEDMENSNHQVGDGEDKQKTVNEHTKLLFSEMEISTKEDCLVCNNKSENNNKRIDEPTDLCFEKFPESEEEKLKRNQIEKALKEATTPLETWQNFAISEYGLINDDLRRQVWPLLVSINMDDVETAPSLEELKSHPEYNQVVLDVNRSLKRFPPGIPYDQRVALQDQLTVLILRVIMKYPHLKYYQGYHDVAVTFLLVVGEEVAFHVMEILSTNHLVECMQETMEPTEKRLKFLYPIIRKENRPLCEFIERSSVGTLFALPWYLTWFGHSLNQYRAVVRLYDYFLAKPFLLPIYVTAAIVLFREDEIFKEDCDMASLHCLLSQLPDDLPFEYLLRHASELYERHPPAIIEKDVEELIVLEKEQRRIQEEEATKRRKLILERRNNALNPRQPNFMYKIVPSLLLNRRSVIVTTAFSILVGLCAYYYKAHLINVGIR